jgi:hypothetical protein
MELCRRGRVSTAWRHAAIRRNGQKNRTACASPETACTAKVTANGLTGGDSKRHCLTLAIAFFLAGKPFLTCGDTRRQARTHGAHP